MSKKQRLELQKGDSNLAIMSQADLLGTSFLLSHVDVVRNLRQNICCEYCGTATYMEKKLPRVCDFSYPCILGVNLPPEGSDGRAFACHRGVICPECEIKHVGRGKKYYGCKQCRAGPETVSDAWGSGIGFPRYLLRKSVLHILSFPTDSLLTDTRQQPWQLVEDLKHELQLRREAALLIPRDAGNAVRLVHSAAAYLRVGRERGLSLGALDAVLKVLYSLHSDLLLLEGGCTLPPKLMLPETIETVVRRVEGTVIMDKDIVIQEYLLDQSPLRQKRLVVRVWVADLRLLIQSQLSDPMYPPGSFKIVGREDLVPTLETSTGVPVRGSEVTDGERFYDLVQTCPQGTKLLHMIAFSDGIQVGSDSYYPTLLSVGNFPLKYRNKREAIMHAAFAEKPVVRKPRHSKVAERLCEEQKIWKQMLQSRTLAQIFAILEHFARVPQDFWVRIADGSFKLVSFSIRWGMWQCDAEGTDL